MTDFTWVAGNPKTKIANVAESKNVKKIEEFKKCLEVFGELHGAVSKIGEDNILNNPKLQEAIDRCLKLKGQFKVVKRDISVLRRIPVGEKVARNRQYLEVPLVWRSVLPVKAVKVRTFEGHTIKAKVPHPTAQAVKQIEKHGEKFDKMEIWWVPNDLVAKKIPDPVLVGRIDLPNIGRVYFELHRWVDETSESAYWSKEGY